ncbi:MAG: hypothetical protein IKS94_02755 [Prevotella sp.]|nr:hypothetical protein [Prevotella sp.]
MALFDFQSYVQELREKVKDGTIEMWYPSILDSITEDTKFEDLPVYKEYISQFDVASTFKDSGIIGIKVPSGLEKDFDYTLLLQLVAASFSNDYELRLNSDSKFVDLMITAKSGLQKLEASQIIRLFEIYIYEQLNLEGLRMELKEEEIECFDEEFDNEFYDDFELKRQDKISEFNKMVLQLKEQPKNHRENAVIDDKPDELQ